MFNVGSKIVSWNYYFKYDCIDCPKYDRQKNLWLLIIFYFNTMKCIFDGLGGFNSCTELSNSRYVFTGPEIVTRFFLFLFFCFLFTLLPSPFFLTKNLSLSLCSLESIKLSPIGHWSVLFAGECLCIYLFIYLYFIIKNALYRHYATVNNTTAM